ncbi:MAG: 6-phosphogluconate dehydrogenase [Gammaproteobacteria bacterium]|nr:6-phosphogluconate dehydrogenase [Gammaproteobacteria bacterium]
MFKDALPKMHIGWIGIGRMGYAMARLLASGGADLTVYNRSIEKAEPLRTQGAKIAADIADLRHCDVVFVMLSTGDVVKDVLFGRDGLLTDGHSRIRLLIDCSSISVEMSVELRQTLAKSDVAFLAAPVSGNPHVVEAGQASFVVSGPRVAFDEIRPFLLTMARAATYVGGGELARVAKICHNVWLGALTQSLAEVTVLAEKAGMTRTSFLDFLNDSALGSIYTRGKAATWQRLDFTATFTPPLMRKDMDLGLSLARKLDAPMPLSSMTREIIQSQINQGFVDVDFSTLLVVQAKSAGLDLVPEGDKDRTRTSDRETSG